MGLLDFIKGGKDDDAPQPQANTNANQQKAGGANGQSQNISGDLQRTPPVANTSSTPAAFQPIDDPFIMGSDSQMQGGSDMGMNPNTQAEPQFNNGTMFQDIPVSNDVSGGSVALENDNPLNDLMPEGQKLQENQAYDAFTNGSNLPASQSVTELKDDFNFQMPKLEFPPLGGTPLQNANPEPMDLLDMGSTNATTPDVNIEGVDATSLDEASLTKKSAPEVKTDLPPVENVTETTDTKEVPLEDQSADSEILGSETEIMQPGKTSGKKDYFRKIALVGLEGTSFDESMGQNVSELVKSLYSNKMEVIIDSDTGLGTYALTAMNEIHAKGMGIYLKPFMAEEQKPDKTDSAYHGGSSVLYSNYLDRLRHIIKESRVFVVFDTGSVYNLSLISTILAISKLYEGSHKPLILFGESWKAKMDSLKNNFGITDINDSTYMIANNVPDLIGKIETLKSTYKDSQAKTMNKVVDRRIEGDEREFVIT